MTTETESEAIEGVDIISSDLISALIADRAGKTVVLALVGSGANRLAEPHAPEDAERLDAPTVELDEIVDEETETIVEEIEVGGRSVEVRVA